MDTVDVVDEVDESLTEQYTSAAKAGCESGFTAGINACSTPVGLENQRKGAHDRKAKSYRGSARISADRKTKSDS